MFLRKIIISALLLFFSINTFAKETLVFAIDLVRHGDRTPHLITPKAVHRWAEGMGQLTAQGMQRAFQLGTSLRKKYVHKYHLLPEHYKNDAILVFSTDYDRTMMSAQSILLGLYPLGTGPLLPTGKPALPSAYQPIPIHIRDYVTKNDRKKRRHLKAQYVTSEPEWQEKTSQLKNKFKKWSIATGLNITSLEQLEN